MIRESPIAVHSGESQRGAIDSEWESSDFDKVLEGVEDTIVMQPMAQTLHRTTHGLASQVEMGIFRFGSI